VYLFEIANKKIIVMQGENHIDIKTGLICITRINQEPQEKDSGKNSRKQEPCKNCKKKRISQENKSHARIATKKESVKNTRTQESCLAMNFLPCQTRFCLQEYHKKVKICFFRQESCIEEMAKESWLITKKSKNLERSEARSSISDDCLISLLVMIYSYSQ